ncbi:MAG: hypothetical protein JWR51_1865 [Devosia sp.]|nr:hypothetical protein [Devosia sp.]
MGMCKAPSHAGAIDSPGGDGKQADILHRIGRVMVLVSVEECRQAALGVLAGAGVPPEHARVADGVWDSLRRLRDQAAR